MQVWNWPGQPHVYLDVTGDPARGYRIERQVIAPDDEVETIWDLSPQQSHQLRAALGQHARSDALEPTDPDRRYDHLVITALESLSPLPEPFTHHTSDP